jgi:DNA mismatch endonuclease (patch repair protein)
MMAGIRGSDTKPERLLRSLLHRHGFRYRLHGPRLPGRPDIVLPKHGVVIFVHGCFWHRHSDCRYAYVPASNRVFWRSKFASNIKRDAAAENQLLGQGWRVLIVWECTIRDAARNPHLLTERITRWIAAHRPRDELPRRPLSLTSRLSHEPRSRGR